MRTNFTFQPTPTQATYSADPDGVLREDGEAVGRIFLLFTELAESPGQMENERRSIHDLACRFAAAMNLCRGLTVEQIEGLLFFNKTLCDLIPRGGIDRLLTECAKAREGGRAMSETCHAGCCPGCGRVVMAYVVPTEPVPVAVLKRWQGLGLIPTLLTQSEASALIGCDCKCDEVTP